MAEKLYIVDTTLRDGEQAPGVSFTIEEKINIAKLLDSMGVDVIEAGIPAMGSLEIETIQEIIKICQTSEVITWNRLKIEDIEASIKSNVKSVHISVPSSDIQIWNKLKKDKNWVLKEVENILDFTHKKGLKISFGAEDSSRADEEFLNELYLVAVRNGASRIRYADTLGILTPLEVFEKIEKIRKKINVDIDFHGHNDFGMATANGLMAFKAGAKFISCSVNGLGERAGNTALDEIVMAVKYLENGYSDINIKKFMKLSEIVAEYSGRKIWESKPFVGEKVFSHESGIHVDGIIKFPSNYEFYPPEDIGRTREIVIGKHSGIASLSSKLNEMGIKVSKQETENILKLYKEGLEKDKNRDIMTILCK